MKGDGDTDLELAKFSMLLPVASVLASEQVLDGNNTDVSPYIICLLR